MTIRRYLTVTVVACLLLCAIVVQGTHNGHLRSVSAAGLAVPPSAGGPRPEPLQASGDLVILESTDDGIIFSLEPATIEREAHASATDGPCLSLRIDGYGAGYQAGTPDLPVRVASFAIPADVSVALSVLEAEYAEDVLDIPVCPVPRPVMGTEPEEPLASSQVELWRDPAVYQADAFWPSEPAQLGEVGYLRDLRMGQVLLSPVQHNPVTGELRHLTRLVARLSFAGTGPAVGAAAGQRLAADDPFSSIYPRAVANWDASQMGANAPEPVATGAPAAQSVNWLPPGVRIRITSTGMYRITYAELQSAGVPVGEVDPRTLLLTQGGEPVAIQVIGEQDGTLDPEDSLVFYGEAIANLYTAQNAYWLSWEAVNTLRMASLNVVPDPSLPQVSHSAHSLLLEEDLRYVSTRPSGEDNDHWYWIFIRADGGPQSETFAFQADRLADAPEDGSLCALLRSYSATTGTHSCALSLNDVPVAEAIWSSGEDYTVCADVDSSTLQNGPNEIKVTCGIGAVSGQTDIIYINRFGVAYPRSLEASGDFIAFTLAEQSPSRVEIPGYSQPNVTAFDVTVPERPVALEIDVLPAAGGYVAHMQPSASGSESRYVVLTEQAYLAADDMELVTVRDLRSAANAADYIVITPSIFADSLDPLMARRSSQGLRTEVIMLEDIYDVFGNGVADAEAIRDFLSYAYSQWTPPAPAYVLLVGDGNYDPKNNLGRNETTYIPPYLSDVDPWLGQTSADNRYVAVHGPDIFPDMFLGRLPAKSIADVETMIAKILQYEDSPPGDWQSQITFVADNPDAAGDFRAYSDALINTYVPTAYSAERIYLGVSPYTSTSATQQAIRSAINGGRLIVNYAGHASTQFWASESLLRFADVPNLTNTLYPLMLPMSCWEGYYINPPTASGADFSSLSEALVRAPGKGAIASFAPGGEGIATGHHFMQEGFYTALFEDSITELGAATTAGKLNLYTSTAAYRELIDTYLLMGDPALRLRVASADLSLVKSVTPAGELAAGDPITYTLAFGNGGDTVATDVVLTDSLPAALLNPQVASSSGAEITLRPGSNLIWDVEDLPFGAGGLITITATIDPAYAGSLTNTAAIHSSVVDDNPLDNQASAVSTVLPADVYVSKAVDPAGSVLPGDPITYTLTFGNQGEAVATDVVLTDPLPAALLAPQVASSSGAEVTLRPGSNLTWDVEDLPLGAGGLITITATIDPAYAGSLTNTAAIHSSAADGNMSDNESSAVSTVLPADVSVAKAVGPAGILAPGDRITYTLTYENDGEAVATGVVLTDTLALTLQAPSYAYSGPIPALRPDTRAIWDIGDLLPGATGIITITATIAEGFTGDLANTASITTLSGELNAANNMSAVTTPVRRKLYLPLVMR